MRLYVIVLLVVAAGVVGMLVGARVQRRMAADGRVECALRSSRPTAWGTPGKWRHGEAEARPGGLRFRPGGPLGMRFPRGAPVEIKVLAAQVDAGRRPRLREMWSINPALNIATLTTPDGPVELAAPARSLPGVVRTLAALSGSEG